MQNKNAIGLQCYDQFQPASITLSRHKLNFFANFAVALTSVAHFIESFFDHFDAPSKI